MHLCLSLTGAVHPLEGFFLHEAGEAVAGGHLFGDLHHHQVLVDLGGGEAEHGRELVLVRGHLRGIAEGHRIKIRKHR